MTETAVKSTEKIETLLGAVPQMLASSGDEQLQMAVGLWPTIKRIVLPMLPDDPEELDKLVEQLALWALRCRSDDAPAVSMVITGGEVAAAYIDEPEPEQPELEVEPEPEPADAGE